MNTKVISKIICPALLSFKLQYAQYHGWMDTFIESLEPLIIVSAFTDPRLKYLMFELRLKKIICRVFANLAGLVDLVFRERTGNPVVLADCDP